MRAPCLVAAFAVAYCAASAAEGLHSMLNQVVQSTGSDVQSVSYCMISTKDIISTAQSTASRVLQGVCSPRELNERFAILETQVVDQFNVLKTMVLNIEDQLRTQDKQIKKLYGRLRKDMRSMRARTREVATPEGTAGVYLPEGEAEVDYDYGMQEEDESPRQAEISRYNSTMHQEEGVRVFTYYWRVGDINYKMENWGSRRSLRSDSFYTFQEGYRMYIRIIPNQRGENVYVHVGLTHGDFDSTLEWPFRLKHRINILDQAYHAEDITSRVWDPTELCSGWNWRRPDSGDNYECVGLGFPQTTLLSRNYIHRNAIVIKLTVFLTS